MQIEVKYREKTKIVDVYHQWDIKKDEIVGVKATKKDIGKYFEFDDGSGWFSKIIGVTPLAVRTEICIVRVADYVHMSKVQYPQTSYSGAYKTEEHDFVREFNRPEHRCVYRLMHEQPIKYLTKRIKMLTVKKLQDKLKSNGVDENFIVGLLVNAASKGNEKVKAIGMLARIGGVNLEPQLSPPGIKGMFVQNNLTIQNQRRNEMEELPAGTSLKAMIAQTKDKLDKVAEDVDFIKEI